MAEENQIPNEPNKCIKVSAASFGAKYASKREVWKFLACDCRAYLSSYDTMTIWHLRDIIAKKRRLIKCGEVKVISVPHYDGLSIDDMLAFAEQYSEVMRALPMVQKEITKLPRAYIANVIHTIVGSPFSQWVGKRTEERNEKVTTERDQIDMDPEIAAIYEASNAVSGKY